MGLRLLREVVLLIGASALYMRLFCLYWCLFAYYVHLLCFLLRLHSMCACFAYWCVFAYYVRLFGLLVRLRLLRAVDLLIVAWVFAYYVRLFYLSVRLRSICACFAYIGASSLTMCICSASAASSLYVRLFCLLVRLRLLSAVVLLVGASSTVHHSLRFNTSYMPLSKSTDLTVAPQSAKQSENGCICFLATLAGSHPYHWRPG